MGKEMLLSNTAQMTNMPLMMRAKQTTKTLGNLREIDKRMYATLQLRNLLVVLLESSSEKPLSQHR